jgi:predicted RNA-binding Zn-ribbon protein involved in translation (DUF1610 family)
MTSLQRSLRCTSCATEANISFSSELEIKEIIVSAECPKCGNSMQLNYQLVGSKNQNQNTLGSQTSLSSTTESNSNTEAFPMSSVEEVFSTTEEIPSDALKDLMED